MSKNIFNTVKMTRPQSSTFDLSHDVKLSCNMGELVPIMVMDCVPGDRFNISCESLLRFQPLVAPVMHRYDVFMHYFFVPNRILWPNWEKWITNTKTAGVLPAHPYLPIVHNGTTYTSLMDYMGVPDPSTIPDANGSTTISPLALAAYQKIYNEYYRDQNLSPEIPYELIDGTNLANITNLAAIRRRAWEHDYFTSALPFAQKGDTVDIPLGDVVLKDDWDTYAFGTPVFEDTTGGVSQGAANYIKQVTDGTFGARLTSDQVPTARIAYNPVNSLEVEATTINDLRLAFRLQEWLEKNARGGTRYTESNRVHFGVTSPDARLQRPEYITGTKSPVNISEVLNSTGTAERPQGDMAGHAVSVTSGQYGSYYCQEHGYIIGIMSVLPRTAYYQGMPKHFTKFDDPTQIYWPTFANIGEQEIRTSELYSYYYSGPGNDQDAVFGYIPRYSEYKYMPSRVAGDFKTTLDFWQHARKFASAPLLNQEFIEADPDNRIFAVEDPEADKLLVHVYNKVRAVRPMPKYGTPTF